MDRKIASIGVGVRHWITMHGFALNVCGDLSPFNHIVPCGIEAKPVTSMAKELGKELSLQDVAHSISRNFGLVFSSQILWLETLDALLLPTQGVPIKVPAELRKLHKEEETFWA